MKSARIIIFIVYVIVILVSCGHPKDKPQVRPQEINSLAQDLGMKDGEQRVKVLSPQVSDPSNSQGSTIIINAAKPAPAVMTVSPGPSSSKSPASPGFKTTASNPDISSPKGATR